MERMMGTSLRDSAFRRIALVAGATSAVMIVLLLARPFYSGPGGAIGSAGVEVITQRAHDTKFETVSIAASPTLDVSPQFFFGAGDGSNGYYAERPASRP
jgi:hypothetical protein